MATELPILPNPDDDDCGVVGGMLGRLNRCMRRNLPSSNLPIKNPTSPEKGPN
jgi:hypothetical protein